MPRAPDDLLADGEAHCALDPCDALTNGAPDVYACPAQYRCGEPLIRPLVGSCVLADAVWGEECRARTPSDGPVADLCAGGMFCSRLACERTSRVGDILGREYEHGVCLDGVGEGGACDSNLAEADRLDPVTAEPVGVGCAPCEVGTWCVPNALQGIDRPGSTCARICTATGAGLRFRDPGRCACGTSACEDVGDVQDGRTGSVQGPFFCRPCVSNSTRFCDPTSNEGCCDPQADCEEVDLLGLSDTTDDARICCRTAGTECVPGVAGQCCHGTRCDDVTSRCATCARVGQDASNTECCPGFARVTNAIDGAPPQCIWCGELESFGVPRVADFICSDERFIVANSNGGFDAVPVLDAEVAWHRVGGSSGGELIASRSDVSRVDYTLTPDHRPYLIQGDLSDGVTANAAFLHLPRSDYSTQSHTRADAALWQSVRIYDSGACSLLVPWGRLLDRIVAGTNQTIPNNSALRRLGITSLQFDRARLRPILRSEPEYARMPLGPQRIRDAVRLRMEYSVFPEILDCGSPAEVDFDVTLRLELAPAFFETADTAASDANATLVGCEVAPDEAGYRCTLPTSSDLSTVAVFDYELAPPGQEDQQALVMAMTSCAPHRDVYLCFGPGLTSTGLPFGVATARRPVEYVEHARDLVLRVDESDLSFPGCFWDAFAHPARVAIVSELLSIGDELRGLVDALTGTDAFSDFGLTPSSVPVCTSDADCHVMSFRSGRRHECDETVGLCSQLHLEPRRVNVRPNGLEVVMAEDLDDPQFSLVNTSFFNNGFSPSGGRLPIAQFLANCVPTRQSVNLSDPPFMGTIREENPPIEVEGLAICDATATSCTGICPEFGWPCSRVFSDGMTGELIPGTSVCTLGVCTR